MKLKEADNVTCLFEHLIYKARAGTILAEKELDLANMKAESLIAELKAKRLEKKEAKS